MNDKLIERLNSVSEPNQYDDKLMNSILTELNRIAKKIYFYVHPFEVSLEFNFSQQPRNSFDFIEP